MKNLSLFLLAMLCCTWSTVRAYELNVPNYSFQSNEDVPFKGSIATQYQRCQVLYLASELSDMTNKNITEIAFKISGYTALDWDERFTVNLREVSNTSFPNPKAWITESVGDTVYSGSLNAKSGKITITFSKPYNYKGGNLLLELIDHVDGGTKTTAVTFSGYNQSIGRAVYGTSTTSVETITCDNITTFLPRITFTYETPVNDKCPEPTDLHVTAINNNSASFAWTAGDSETEWQYLCLSTSATLNWALAQTVTSPSVTVSALTANTRYVLYVRANCGNEDGESKEISTTFTTACAPVIGDAIPYEENFDDIANYEIPSCWNKISNSSYPQVVATEAYGESTKCLRFYGGGPTSSCMIILPLFETAYNKLAISFFYKTRIDTKYSHYGKAIIGYITNPYDASTFVVLDTLDQSESYVYLENYSLEEVPEGAYIAVKYAGGTTDGGNLYIDNLVVDLTASSCPKPTGLEVTDITATSASVSWEKGEAAKSILEYKLSTAETWTVVDPATSPYELKGLTVNSNYDVRVKNSCDEIGESKYTSTSFTTPCENINVDYEHPYSEDFSNVAMSKVLDCWTSVHSMAYPYWGGVSKGHTGKGVACDYEMGMNDLDALLKTPTFVFGSAPTLTFWYKNTGDADFSVTYSVDGGAENDLVTGLKNMEEWTEKVVSLPKSCIGHKVVITFKGIKRDEEGLIYLDDISITCAESCPKPTGLTVDNITASSADFTWTKGATESQWQYICLPSSETADWASAAVKTVTSESVTVSGLNSKTDYTLYLRADCGSEDGYSADLSVDFHTLCGKITALNCGFEESEGYKNGEYPECWKTNSVGTPLVTTTVAHTGAQSLGVSGYGPTYIILPEFENEVNKLQLSFWLKSNSSSAYYNIGTMSDPTDVSTFHKISTKDTEISTSWKEISKFSLADAPATDHYIAIKYFASYNREAYFDDIVVEKAPTCKVPTGLTRNAAPTQTTASLKWTANSGESAWKLQIKEYGEEWGAGINVTTNPYTAEGLIENTLYVARVKAVCGEEDESEWSDEYEFITACDAITIFPWKETFEGMVSGEAPDCWDNLESTTLLSEDTDPEAVWCIVNAAENNMIRMFNYYADNGTAVINSPTIVLPATPEKALTFDYAHTATCGNLDVKISDNGGSTFKSIGQYGTADEIVHVDAISLKSYAGKSIMVQFYAEPNHESGAIIIDNVKIDNAPVTPTFLDETNAAVKTTKLLRDGQILILRGEKVFTVTGQEVK